MARAVGFKNRFNSGELSDENWSNSDLEQHANGCASALNWLPRVSGPLQRRYGFWRTGAPKFADRVGRLIAFARSIEDPLMLEFGDLYCRVWQADGSPLMSGPSQVEFVSPYAAGDLAGLRPRQSGDVLILYHRDGRRPQRLERASPTSWNFAPFVEREGPFRPENADETLTLTRTLHGSHSDLVAAAPLFEAGHVGALWRIKPAAGLVGGASWKAGEAVGAAVLRISDGKVYRTAGGGTCGNTPPTHDKDTASDGGVDWAFENDGATVLRIVAVESATVAQAAPEPGQSWCVGFGEPTAAWAEGSWSDYRGWPTAWPAIREERLVVSGAAGEPDKIAASRTAGYDTAGADFKPGLGTGRVVDDDAVHRFAGDRSARVIWLVSSTFLTAGTAAGELVITGATLDDPMSPASFGAREVSGFGSADVEPAKAHEGLLHVVRGGRALRELIVGADLGKTSRDLSFFADHIADRGFAELAWTGQPDNLLWARLEDGGLAAFVYHPEQRVYGWATQQLGGGFVAESLAVLPGSFGRDALWVLARRTKGGATQRQILMLSARRETLRLDAAQRYSGAPTGAVSGLDWLAGETVTAMAGPGGGVFAEYANLVVSPAGVLSLPDEVTAAEIVVGLPYLSRYEGLPTDLEGPGTTQGKRTRVTQMIVVLTGVEARVGVTGAAQLDTVGLRDLDETETRRKKRINARVTCEGGADRDVRLVVETANGFDLVLHALRPEAYANA